MQRQQEPLDLPWAFLAVCSAIMVLFGGFIFFGAAVGETGMQQVKEGVATAVEEWWHGVTELLNGIG